MIGTTLSHFKITAKLGEGGMGEVYRAEDTKLGREVAIKVLPQAMAQDTERLARFEREARALAALNHPNIAGIYSLESVSIPAPTDASASASPDASAGATDVGEGLAPSQAGAGPAPTDAAAGASPDASAGAADAGEGLAPSRRVDFLVMELVEGEDLKERLDRGPVAVDEARAIALQVASALETAHESGIIHRDLKPANIKVTPGGQVKVLDFGLAKAFDPTTGSDSDRISVSLSPTLTAQMTQAGVLLGTAAYMAPEQARGLDVDKQADIWAFGAVLFEMLSGRITFPGATVTDVIAAVVSHEPDWEELPEETPWNLREVMKLCLTKDARERIHDIGDARLLLTRPLAPEATTIQTESAAGWQRWLPWAVAAALAILATALALSPGDSRPVDHPIQRLSIMLPPEVFLAASEAFVLSPDGSKLVLVGVEAGVARLYLRSLESTAIEVLPETEGAQNPFFSPDGESIGFSSDGEGKMFALSLATGRAHTIAEGGWGGGSWGLDDIIVYTPTYTDGLHRVPAIGGTPEELTRPDLEKRELGHFWPQHLPGGNRVLFTIFSVPLTRSSIHALDLETGQIEAVIEDGVWGRYSPTGHLLFVRDQTLMAVGFDPDSLQIAGAPIPVVEDLIPDIGQGDTPVTFSANGTLAYVPGAIMRPPQQLTWVDRDGRETPFPEMRRYGQPRISPDGTRIAVTIEAKSSDLWALELGRGTLSRLTSEPATQFGAVWVPDGNQIVYSQDDPPYNLHRRPVDGGGPGEPLLRTAVDNEALSISPDGSTLMYSHNDSPSGYDLWTLSLVGESEPEPWLATPFEETFGTFSPDGRWMAYTSNETGTRQVYVSRYPEGDQKLQVSLSGGTRPLWSRDGREIFFRLGQSMMAVDVLPGERLTVGEPRELFRGSYRYSTNKWGYDISADGRFVMIRDPDEDRPREIKVVLNWFLELEALVPTP